jgi:3-phenylpropionate/trans-cinnamate dioxygenase ferredoxin subunit
MTEDPSYRMRLRTLELGRPVRIEIAGVYVCVVATELGYHAVADQCTHEDVSLTEGDRVDVEEVSIECWKHGSQFSLLTGIPLCPPANEPLVVYETTVDGDDLVIGDPLPTANGERTRTRRRSRKAAPL